MRLAGTAGSMTEQAVNGGYEVHLPMRVALRWTIANLLTLSSMLVCIVAILATASMGQRAHYPPPKKIIVGSWGPSTDEVKQAVLEQRVTEIENQLHQMDVNDKAYNEAMTSRLAQVEHDTAVGHGIMIGFVGLLAILQVFQLKKKIRGE